MIMRLVFRIALWQSLKGYCWAEAPIKIARMTLTIKLDGNWNSFQLANSAPPLSVTDSAIAPSARIFTKAVKSKIASPLQHHTTFFVERGIYSFTAPELWLSFFSKELL